ncbi:MAG: hypothetical protein PHV78_03670 [Patescibacteria group bacterium]|nr:hypothetical protein [Patescibacteria group bacterium]
MFGFGSIGELLNDPAGPIYCGFILLGITVILAIPGLFIAAMLDTRRAKKEEEAKGRAS